MTKNIIQEKSYQFALKAVSAYKLLTIRKKEYKLSKQFLKSATSIGANIEEALGGQSSKDFISRLSIAFKEARETIFWLRLLQDSGYLQSSYSKPLLENCEEICRILSKIITSSKANLRIKTTT